MNDYLLVVHNLIVKFFQIFSTNSEVFPKFAVFMDTLGVVVPAPISKKSLFGVITSKTTR